MIHPAELTIHSNLSYTEDKTEVLLDVDYERYETKGETLAEIVLYTRNQQGKRNRYRIRGFLPYFYVDTTPKILQELVYNNRNLNSWFDRYEKVTKTIYDGGTEKDLLKIYGKQPWLVPTVRNIFFQHNISYYEADIPFTHRFMIDYNLKGLLKIELNGKINSSDFDDFVPKICSLDIEIDTNEDNQTSFETIIEEASRRITAIGFTYGKQDQRKSRVFITNENSDNAEIKCITSALECLWNEIDPDGLVTYNGDSFDFPYLLQRMKNLDVPITKVSPYGNQKPVPPKYGNGWQIPGVLVFDLYRKTKWLYTDDGRKTLDSVAEKLLGTSKIEITIGHGELWRQSLNTKSKLEQFEEYVERDVDLTYQLWTAMNMPEWLEVIKISGGPPGDAIYFTERQSGEFLVYQTMFQNHILIPSAPTPEERRERKKHRKSAQGGLVLDPKKSIATSVLICDFASMYPSIIAAHNVGGESFKGIEGKPRNRFANNPKTAMAMMQEQMLKKRSVVKQQLKERDLSEDERKRLEAYSGALKIVANSTFGAYNYIGSRFYDTDIASTITGIGRNYLKDLSKKVEEFGDNYQTIYGDTDSVFIETPLDSEIQSLWELPHEQARDYERYVSKIPKLLKFLTQLLPSEMQLELEDIAYRIIFHRGAKKRYAYISAIDKTISIMGFEAIRHDWSPFAKEAQKKAFEVLLHSGDLKYTKQQILDFIHEQLNMEPKTLKDKLTTLGAIKRNPKNYKVETPAIGAFKHHMQQMGEDPEQEWRNIDYFPFIIVKGDDAQKDRARHPQYVNVNEIDIQHYIKEALRTVNRFNLNISLDEARGIEYQDLTKYF